MSNVGAWSLVCGMVLGVGLWAILSVLPRMGRPRLADRVAPYIMDLSPSARMHAARISSDPLPVIGALVGPALASLRRALDGVLGGTESTRLRLRQSGSSMTVEAFRSRQLSWILIGTGLGLAGAVLLAPAGLPFPAHAAIVVLAAVGALFLCDQLLQRRAAARMTRISAELPVVLEFLTLSLSAGEGIGDAFRRVSRFDHGELSAELAGVIAAVHSGLPLAAALRRLADDLRLPALTRCIDQITGALERGTPLTEVLRAQTQDSREDGKRRLLEQAGKKEVAMLVPLIFLILPMTILFAIFPGIFVLQVGF